MHRLRLRIFRTLNSSIRNGRILKSWLESGNSNAASRTIYWIELPQGIPANTVLNIYWDSRIRPRLY